ACWGSLRRARVATGLAVWRGWRVKPCRCPPPPDVSSEIAMPFLARLESSPAEGHRGVVDEAAIGIAFIVNSRTEEPRRTRRKVESVARVHSPQGKNDVSGRRA